MDYIFELKKSVIDDQKYTRFFHLNREGKIDPYFSDYYGYYASVLARFQDKIGYCIASLCGAVIKVDKERDRYYIYNRKKPENINATLQTILFTYNNAPDSFGLQKSNGFSFGSEFFYGREITKFKGAVGYESRDLIKTFLAKRNISLKEFLLDSRYVILADDWVWPVYSQFEENGLFSDNIKLIYHM